MNGRILVLLGMCAMFGMGVRAQEVPKVEVFGGYSYGNFGGAAFGGSRTNSNGWNASVAVNANRWVGLVTDFAGHYEDFHSSVPLQPLPCIPPACSIETRGTNKYHNILFGPQFTLRREKISPFAHFLFGVVHVNQSGTTTIPFPPPLPPQPIPLTFHFSESTNNLAVAAGGGADFRLSERIAWRVQADYLVTQISSRTQNDLRLSTGLVFRF